MTDTIHEAEDAQSEFTDDDGESEKETTYPKINPTEGTVIFKKQRLFSGKSIRYILYFNLIHD